MLQKFKKMDYVIVFVLVLMMGISITSIYSTTVDTKFEGSHLRMIAFILSASLPFRNKSAGLPVVD